MQLKKFIPPPYRQRMGVQISARRFLRYCSKIANKNSSKLIERIRMRARIALKAFPKLQIPVRIDCPHVQKIVQSTQEILESIKEGVRCELETGLLNYQTWASLLNAAKTTAHEISTNLTDTGHGLTEKFTQFLSTLIGDVNHRIKRIENANKVLLQSISANKQTFVMTYSTSKEYSARVEIFNSRRADSRYKISLPQTAANTYLRRTY